MRNFDVLAETQADVICIQEHSLTEEAMQKAKGLAGSRGFQLHADAAKMIGDKAVGGTGILVRRPMTLFTPKPKTPAFSKFADVGRLSLALVGIGSALPLL
eukprot:12364801-Alexandrium_andersonii.AAC.1